MRHPRIRDFDHNDACQALRAWLGRRFPKFVDRKGFEDQLESAVIRILQAQDRLAAALEFQLIDRSVRLTQKQSRAQAEDIWKSHDVADERGARDAALRIVDAKPPPTRWRRKLQRLRANTDRFSQVIADRDIRTTIRWGARRAGILDKCGPHWLHHLRDNSDELRLAIETALNDPWLREDVGRPDEHHFVGFVVEVMVACRDLTDRTLSHKVRRKGDTRAEIPSNDIGVVESPDILLLQELLAPFGDKRSADSVSHLIRKARKTTNRRESTTT